MLFLAKEPVFNNPWETSKFGLSTGYLADHRAEIKAALLQEAMDRLFFSRGFYGQPWNSSQFRNYGAYGRFFKGSYIFFCFFFFVSNKRGRKKERERVKEGECAREKEKRGRKRRKKNIERTLPSPWRDSISTYIWISRDWDYEVVPK